MAFIRFLIEFIFFSSHRVPNVSVPFWRKEMFTSTRKDPLSDKKTRIEFRGHPTKTFILNMIRCSNNTFSMEPSHVPRCHRRWRSLRTYAPASSLDLNIDAEQEPPQNTLGYLNTGSLTISISGMPARFKSMQYKNGWKSREMVPLSCSSCRRCRPTTFSSPPWNKVR